MIRQILRLAAVCFLSVSAANAQRPVVLAHGILSGPGTWDTMRDQINQVGDFTPYTPQLHWTTHVVNQSADLRDFINQNSIGLDAYFVGHSLGGLVIRKASHELDPIAGYVTIGTPHQGAPIGNHLWYPAWYFANLWFDLWVMDYTLWPVLQGPEEDPLRQALVRAYDDIGTDNFDTWTWILAGTGLVASQIGSDMRADATGNTSFLSDLHLSEGSVAVANKAAVQCHVDAGYAHAGPMLFLPMSHEEAEGRGQAIVDDGVDLVWTSLDFLIEFFDPEWPAPISDVVALTGTAAMIDIAYIYVNWASEWNYDVVGGWPNDGLIPTERQTFGGVNAFSPFDCNMTHTEETSDGAPILLDMLRNRFH